MGPDRVFSGFLPLARHSIDIRVRPDLCFLCSATTAATAYVAILRTSSIDHMRIWGWVAVGKGGASFVFPDLFVCACVACRSGLVGQPTPTRTHGTSALQLSHLISFILFNRVTLHGRTFVELLLNHSQQLLRAVVVVRAAQMIELAAPRQPCALAHARR